MAIGQEHSRWIRLGAAFGLGAIAVWVLVEQVSPGWGRSAVLTMVVFGYLVIDYRTLWRRPSYWALMLMFLSTHLLLLFWLRDFMDQFRVIGTLVLALVEVFIFMMILAFSIDGETTDADKGE